MTITNYLCVNLAASLHSCSCAANGVDTCTPFIAGLVPVYRILAQGYPTSSVHRITLYAAPSLNISCYKVSS